MAGSQITTKTNEVEKQRLGYIAISFDEWDSTNEPEIQSGSKVEIAGSLYEFTAAEDIDPDADWGGFANSTQIYGYLVVSGTSVTSKLKTTAPTWDTAKQGWYEAATTNRCYSTIYKDSGGNYDKKCILNHVNKSPDNSRIFNKTYFLNEIYDKNGVEVTGMQVETDVTNSLNLANGASGDLVASGYSFNPTSILMLRMTTNTSVLNNSFWEVNSITFGVGSVTINITNRTGATVTFTAIITAALTG